MSLYVCEINGSAAALDAHLNEYCLYSSTGASHNYSTNIRPWMEKANLFRIKISQSGRAKNGEAIQFGVRATVTEIGKRKTLCEMRFPSGVAATQMAELPFDTLGKALNDGQNLSFICEDPRAIVEKPWRADKRLISNPIDIYKYYEEIQKHFLDGNVARIMELSTARISFGAKLFNKDRSLYEKQVYDDLVTTFSSKPQWKTVQRPAQELTVHEFLPGKVVRILDLFENPPLRTTADKDGMQVGYDIILAMTTDGLTWIM